MNFFKTLYGDVKKEEMRQFKLVHYDVRWGCLSGEFTTKFALGSKVPVGKTQPSGFQFELNYLNYFPIVPVVNVKQKGLYLDITRYYDKKSKAMQYYWMSIFAICIVFFSIGLIWDQLIPPPEPNSGIVAGPIFFIVVWLLLLVIFHRIRNKLWGQSLERAEELLKFAKVEYSKS